jgi:hypothetical protein
MTETEIKQKAKDVEGISQDYHLTHAVFACTKILHDTRRKQYGELKKELEKAYTDNTKTSELLEQKKQMDEQNRFHVLIDYVTGMDKNSARVVKTDNKLVISIPRGLLDDVQGGTGAHSVQDSVSKIRFLMAHELGHICLNADKIQLGLIGSLALDPDAERGADIFAKELLRLRDERNKNLHKRA